jgi:hypothetical protein
LRGKEAAEVFDVSGNSYTPAFSAEQAFFCTDIFGWGTTPADVMGRLLQKSGYD